MNLEVNTDYDFWYTLQQENQYSYSHSVWLKTDMHTTTTTTTTTTIFLKIENITNYIAFSPVNSL